MKNRLVRRNGSRDELKKSSAPFAANVISRFASTTLRASLCQGLQVQTLRASLCQGLQVQTLRASLCQGLQVQTLRPCKECPSTGPPTTPAGRLRTSGAHQ